MTAASTTDTTELRITGASAGYTNAHVVLETQGSANYRGAGIFMMDSVAEKVWYMGRPYQTADSFVISRQATLDEWESTATTTHGLLHLTYQGSLQVKDSVRAGGLAGRPS